MNNQHLIKLVFWELLIVALMCPILARLLNDDNVNVGGIAALIIIDVTALVLVLYSYRDILRARGKDWMTPSIIEVSSSCMGRFP